MFDIDMLIKLRNINNNLEYAKSNLMSAKKILSESITFNGNGFYYKKIQDLSDTLETQKNNLNTKINSIVNGG